MKNLFTTILIFLIVVFNTTAITLPKKQKSNSFSDVLFVNFEPAKNEKNYFIIGEDSQTYTAERTIFPFRMNAYETSYNLWYVVRLYAEQKGYVFKNLGQGGSNGKCGAPPTKKNAYEPVTMISWYDAIIWCNAYSEMLEKKPCYTYNGNILRDATDTATCDMAKCDFTSDGFRLPTEAEWEYAARYTKNGLQSGSLASGETNELHEEDVAWFDKNSNSTHIIGTAGTPFLQETQDAPGSGIKNGAGIFDMSGNVLEFCWDWLSDYKEEQKGERATGPKFGEKKVSRGGSWSPYTMFICAGDRYGFDPNEAYSYMGFRFCSGK